MWYLMSILQRADTNYAVIDMSVIWGVGCVCDPGNFEVVEKPGRNGHVVVLPREESKK